MQINPDACPTDLFMGSGIGIGQLGLEKVELRHGCDAQDAGKYAD
jgi:hypothetical protein